MAETIWGTIKRKMMGKKPEEAQLGSGMAESAKADIQDYKSRQQNALDAIDNPDSAAADDLQRKKKQQNGG